MKTPLVLALAAVALTGCAGKPAPVVAWKDNCRAERPAVIATRVSTRGAKLATMAAELPAPDRAIRLEKGGYATLSCRPSAGRLADCQLLSETPEGIGFGRTAIQQAGLVIYPADDAPARVEVTFRYDLVRPAEGTVCS